MLHGTKLFLAAALMVVALIFFAYGNHFRNSFHFDDFHTIVDNPSVRDLHNIPHFFTDARTISVQLNHQSYRPLVTVSLAVDYRLGNGPQPLYFHLTTFAWYLVLLFLVYFLFLRLMDTTDRSPSNRWYALFAAAVYGLHPVSAETVNYIVQRAEIMSTAGVVAGLVLYIWAPKLRRTGLYLVPVALGMLAKTPAAVFAGLLLVYILLFEEDWNLPRTLVRSTPAVVVCTAIGAFATHMEKGTFSPGGSGRVRYWLTQPAVTWHYFRSFFWPSDLTADSDMEKVSGLWDVRTISGILFVGALCALILWASRNRSTRPIGFGLAWFLLALVPTAFVPLAEVANDHRMFFAFVGLTLATVWTVRLLAGRQPQAIAVAAGLVLAVCTFGTRQRNEVWSTEDTLWQDVVLKSPRNGRGLMNYGVTLMKTGDFNAALGLFQQALEYAPDYSLLHANIGIAQGALKQNALAESHFKRAIELDPSGSQGYYSYARWMVQQRRTDEAVPLLEAGLKANPYDSQCRMLLLQLYVNRAQWAKLDTLIADSLRFLPNDPAVLRYRSARTHPELFATTPEAFLEESESLYRAGRFQDSIQAAQHALELKPDYAEAYNNIAAASNALGDFDQGIRAAREAIRLKPDFALARNNLEWAKSRKAAMNQ